MKHAWDYVIEPHGKCADSNVVYQCTSMEWFQFVGTLPQPTLNLAGSHEIWSTDRRYVTGVQ